MEKIRLARKTWYIPTTLNFDTDFLAIIPANVNRIGLTFASSGSINIGLFTSPPSDGVPPFFTAVTSSKQSLLTIERFGQLITGPVYCLDVDQIGVKCFAYSLILLDQ